MNCLRCGSQMYSVVGVDGAKATCAGCSQYVDCAKCHSQKCGDVRCLKCYNRALTGARPKPSPSIIPEDQEL